MRKAVGIGQSFQPELEIITALHFIAMRNEDPASNKEVFDRLASGFTVPKEVVDDWKRAPKGSVSVA